jgi:hypothetical protein
MGKSSYLLGSGAVFVELFVAAHTDLCNQWHSRSFRSFDAKLVPTSISFAFFLTSGVNSGSECCDRSGTKAQVYCDQGGWI